MTDHSDLLPISVREGEDESFIIEWDETDPRAVEMGINDWTPDDWLKAIEEALQRVDQADHDVNHD